jgi:hypothetical protein
LQTQSGTKNPPGPASNKGAGSRSTPVRRKTSAPK